jgi:hypothetical protein
MGSAKTAMKSSLVDAEKFLEQLTTLGKMHDATGEVEDVAGGLTELMESTLQTAQSEGADSDYYDAHAVLLNLKRKQMDSAGGMLAIARETNDAELRKAATAFQKAQKSSAETLTSSWPRTPPRSLPPHDRRARSGRLQHSRTGVRCLAASRRCPAGAQRGPVTSVS